MQMQLEDLKAYADVHFRRSAKGLSEGGHEVAIEGKRFDQCCCRDLALQYLLRHVAALRML